jgi:hypothetical protein
VSAFTQTEIPGGPHMPYFGMCGIAETCAASALVFALAPDLPFPL